MAAHAILPFIHLNDYASSIIGSIDLLDLLTAKNNTIHGTLLWIQVLIKTLIDLNQKDELKNLTEPIKQFYIKLKDILKIRKIAPISFGVLMDIFDLLDIHDFDSQIYESLVS